jgi:hypothetical protein
MKRPRTTLLLASLFALAISAVSFAETVEDHANKPIKTVVVTSTRLAPQDLRMGTGDVLSFQNLSMKMMQLTFTEPKNVGQKTTCQLLKRVSPTEAVAPGAVFQRQGDQVTALIAPGMFVSVCSLAPGTYVYTAAPVFEGALNNDATLGMKGTIVVE